MSTIIATTLSNGSVSVPTATVVNGSAKAWVNFNGTGTVAIREGFNVSSITDNGTGDYTVNFTTAQVDADYCGTMSILEAAVRLFYAPTITASSMRVVCVNTAQTPSDNAVITASITR